MDTGFPALIPEPDCPEGKNKTEIPQDEHSFTQEPESISRGQLLGFLRSISKSDPLSW